MPSIYHYYKKRKKSENSRGFLMLYAILFITVVLTISLEILNISMKRIIVSSIGEESARALYAADSGMECAFYLDLYKGYFSTSTPETTYTNICDTNSIKITPPSDPFVSPLIWESSSGSKVSFQVKFGSGRDLICANVYIIKNLYPSGAIKSTLVQALGYNTDCPGNTALRLPLTERRIQTTY